MKLKLLIIPSYVRIYPISSLFYCLSLGILAPLQIIYYRHIGITVFQIGFLSSVLEISILLFELPTGFAADKLGRKFSVCSSFVCLSASGIIFMFFKSIPGLTIATFIQGFGFTLMSGAFQAWGVDKLIENNAAEYTDSLITDVTRFQKTGYLIGSVLGGFLGVELMNFIWCFYILLNIMCLVIVLIFMKEVKKKPMLIKKDKNSLFKGISFIPAAVKFIIILGIISLLNEFSQSPIDEYWTVYFTENLRIATAAIGIIIAANSLMIILFIKPINNFMSNHFSKIASMKIILSAAAASSVFMIISRNPVSIVIFYTVFRLSLGIYFPSYDSYLNSLIHGSHRATLLSLSSTLGAVGESVSGVLIGLIAQSAGIRLSFCVSTAGFLVLILLFLTLQKLKPSLS